MLDFNFYLPTKIIFGKNKLDKLGSEILNCGSRVLLVYGKGSIKKIMKPGQTSCGPAAWLSTG